MCLAVIIINMFQFYSYFILLKLNKKKTQMLWFEIVVRKKKLIKITLNIITYMANAISYVYINVQSKQNKSINHPVHGIDAYYAADC